MKTSPLFSDDYLGALYANRGRWQHALMGYAARLRALIGARRFDLLIIEKELFPFMPAGFERLLGSLGVPYVVDYDDALFHRYDLHRYALVRRIMGRKIDVVMRHATVVVAGNDYLAERARAAGASRVEVIPTVVDTERYQPRLEQINETPIVGWIGTPKTSKYLRQLLPVFKALQSEVDVRLVAVGARGEDFADTPVEAWRWSEESEAAAVEQFDIGIMPLPDSPWERGKCGYKLIQYMACGRPVVASPVGVNNVIVKAGFNGFLAKTEEQWGEALTELLCDREKQRKFGLNGRVTVEKGYSLQAHAPRLLEILEDAAQ